jgi:hypothetical protein
MNALQTFELFDDYYEYHVCSLLNKLTKIVSLKHLLQKKNY